MQMDSPTFTATIQQHATSGTSAEPNSTSAPMLMSAKGKWTLMFHGSAFINMIQQSGPRGYDKVFSTNWFMPMAQRKLGDSATLTLRTMLSLEPATVTGRYYPELFQVGETAFGKGIVDGQHPHDLFMEIAALYDHKLTDNTLLSFYAAPVGDPAMGPAAYPHRASASENPLAPLGHHFQDSTHIASDVVTVGLTHRAIRIEASGFHGREPDENRWNIDQGKLDSWSTRLTVNPAANWSAQYSFARLSSPEVLHATEDVDRMTSSVMYNRPLQDGNFAATVLWGRNKDSAGEVLNGYLAEGTLRFKKSNNAWTRIELADRTAELLSGKNALPNSPEQFIGRVKAFTVGYDREFGFIPHLTTAIGGQVNLYSAPDSLKAIYGSHPAGVVLFVHFTPKRGSEHQMN
ncbi:MAG: hypothetical protein JWO13_3568 [Acidobacteriales bacterium]|nr:hypothetical protein [Terriglobales bacterium]